MSLAWAWHGLGMGSAWAWHGHGMGLAWAWNGHGMALAGLAHLWPTSHLSSFNIAPDLFVVEEDRVPGQQPRPTLMGRSYHTRVPRPIFKNDSNSVTHLIYLLWCDGMGWDGV